MGTLTLEEGIEVISESAFVEEGQLRHLNLPSTLKSIGKHAFLFSMLGRDNLEIRCLATTPPVCEEDVFDISTWSNPNAVLSVPRESIDLYKSVEPWSRFGSFGTIKEASVGEIYIDDGECVIYNLGGTEVFRGDIKNVIYPAPGIYILKKGGKTKKISIR